MPQQRYIEKLEFLYGKSLARKVLPRFKQMVELHRGRIPAPGGTSLSERDSILITYPDQVQDDVQPQMLNLLAFCEASLRGVVSGIHILPFYPSSSDDGFSVKDHRAVDPTLGDWSSVERLGQSFRLMIDGVINHASVKGEWFQAFLRDEKPYRDYFLTVQDAPDLSKVVRPRSSPLITEFQTRAGIRRVWTTFSADQADLDYHNPEVLLDIFNILMTYTERGAQFIRLDAVAYLWKEIGTACIHLPQTHAIIRLLREVLDELAPQIQLVTETNVPHAENLTYFGDGQNEAQLIYNFALPPLVLHTFRTGDASIISHWASGLEKSPGQTTFLNFLASHDGIGLNPAAGILSPDDIAALVKQTLAHGGLISFKQNTDGTRSPYELNINYFDALSDPVGGEPLALQVDRFMAAQAIMLSLRGLPGIYFHSLFGSRNWLEGVITSGRNRQVNRQKLARKVLDGELADPGSLRAQVFTRYKNLLAQRSVCAAFHPYGGQEIIDMGTAVFAVLRSSPQNDRQILCLQNVTAQRQSVEKYTLEPYETLWQENP